MATQDTDTQEDNATYEELLSSISELLAENDDDVSDEGKKAADEKKSEKKPVNRQAPKLVKTSSGMVLELTKDMLVEASDAFLSLQDKEEIDNNLGTVLTPVFKKWLKDHKDEIMSWSEVKPSK